MQVPLIIEFEQFLRSIGVSFLEGTFVTRNDIRFRVDFVVELPNFKKPAFIVLFDFPPRTSFLRFQSRVIKLAKVFPDKSIIVVIRSGVLNRPVFNLPNITIFEFGTPAQYSSIEIVSDKFNFDYSHFLPWHDGGCASFHGHSSVISVRIYGIKDSHGWLVDFGKAKEVVMGVIKEVDHKVFVNKKYCDEVVGTGCLRVRWQGFFGSFDLILPENRVVLLDTDSTVENLSEWFAERILKQLPNKNVEKVSVTMNEGIGKSACSCATRKKG